MEPARRSYVDSAGSEMTGGRGVMNKIVIQVIQTYVTPGAINELRREGYPQGVSGM